VAVIPIIVVSLIVGLYLYSIPSNSNSATTSSGAKTVTGASTFSSTNSPQFGTTTQSSLSLQRSTVTRYSSDKNWEYSVFASVDSENVDLNSTLTYLSSHTAEFEIDSPIDFLSVIYQNGTVVWNWAVPGALRLLNVTQGETFLGFNQIPDSVMKVPGTYTIRDIPLLNAQNGTSLQDQLALNVTVESSGFAVAPTTIIQSNTTVTFGSTLSQTEFFVAGKTYPYNSIPSSFKVGNFSIYFLNKLFTTSGNQTPFALLFNVTVPGGSSSLVRFLWTPPCSLALSTQCNSNNTWTGSDPEYAEVDYGAASLMITWWINFSRPTASFDQLDQIQTTTTTSSTPTNQTSIVLDTSDGANVCQELGDQGNFTSTWSGNVCTLFSSSYSSGLNLDPNTTLDIMPGVTLALDGHGSFTSYGPIINNGTLEPDGWYFESYGLVDNAGVILTNSSIDNGGTFENYGTLLITGHYSLYQKNETYPNGTTYIRAGGENLTGGYFANGGTLDNYGVINNTGWFWNPECCTDSNTIINNYGTINNLPYAIFVNNATIINKGVIQNSATFENSGTVINFCSGNFIEAQTGHYPGNTVMGYCATTTSTTIEKDSSTP